MGSNNDIKNKTIINLLWKFAERSGAQLVTFVVSIILARLIEPEEYGLIALVTVFTTILQVFVDSGFGSALIQKKDVDSLDFSTVFYFNMFCSLILYILMFTLSPFISEYYGNTSLTSIIRVSSLIILVSGVRNIQQSFVSKHMIFKKFFFSTIAGTLCSAIAGIVLAYRGFGVWALIAQQLLNSIVGTCVLWCTVKWRPSLEFSFQRLKGLFSYGWKMLVSSLINTIYNEIRQLVIGKKYSSMDLAYYNRGGQFPTLITTNVNSSIDSVLLPVMSKCQNNKESVKLMTRKSIMTSSYIMWPIMFGLMAIGEPLVKIVLTEKWLPCLPYLYIFCFVRGMAPIHTANLNAIKALGRSDLYLKMEIIKKSIGIIIILVSMNYGVIGIGMGSIVYTIFASMVNSYPNKNILNYSYLEQIKDIMPSFSLAFIMGVLVYFVSYISIAEKLLMPIQIISGIIIYLIGSIVLKIDSFYFLIDILKKMKYKYKEISV